jgi:hypothetical protein
VKAKSVKKFEHFLQQRKNRGWVTRRKLRGGTKTTTILVVTLLYTLRTHHFFFLCCQMTTKNRQKNIRFSSSDRRPSLEMAKFDFFFLSWYNAVLVPTQHAKRD